MSIHIITAENIREPLPGLLETILERHIAHRLVDDFLVLTPDEASAVDLERALLQNPRLDGVLTGASVLSLPAWVSAVVRELEPKALAAPAWVHEALFLSLAGETPPAGPPPGGGAGPPVQSSWGERVSLLSLFQLVAAFRGELKSLDVLHSFVSDLDPILADDCRRLAQAYAAKIDALSFCKDFAWRVERVLTGIEKGEIRALKRIRALYWLGFLNPTPLLQALTEAIQAFFPKIEQVLHIQMPRGTDPQDWAASRFEGKQIHHFAAPKKETQKTEFLEFPGPFDEAGEVLEKIHTLCEKGEDPDSIALFLPSDPFWESYFSSELVKLGLKVFPTRTRSLASFPDVAETLLLRPEEAQEKTQDLLKRLQKEKPSGEKPRDRSLFLRIRALHQWNDVLHQVLFYRTEMEKQKDLRLSLTRIASSTFLEEPRREEKAVALRSHREAGLKSFSHAFLWGLTEQALPFSPERFFGRALPDSNREGEVERARFQHLLGVGKLTSHLSYSIHAPQGEEIPATPFLFEFGFVEPRKSRHAPVFTSRHLRKGFEERLRMELLRDRDSDYRHAHGGWIQDQEVLAVLRKRVKDHVFTPGQLEDFSQCPFKFYAGVLLGLKPPEEKEPEGSAAERGSWVHRFLETFFSRHRADILKAGREPQGRGKILDAVEPDLQGLSQEFLQERPWIHETLSRDFMERTVTMTQSLLEKTWEIMASSERPFLPAYFEKAFGKGESPPLTFANSQGLTLRIGGRIDRIDVTEDEKEFLVFDYKTGDSPELSRRIKELKSLQLPLYIAAAERILEGAEGLGALVLGLKEMKDTEGMLKKSERKRLSFKGRSALYEEEEWRDYWPRLQEQLLKLLERILSGDLRTAPDPCDEFCEFGTICRYHERKKSHR